MLRLYKQAALYDLPNNKLSELMAISNEGEGGGGVPINCLLMNIYRLPDTDLSLQIFLEGDWTGFRTGNGGKLSNS